MSVIEPVPPKQPRPRPVPSAPFETDNDLDVVAKPGIRFESEDQVVPEICPNCARPTKKHTPGDAWECMQSLEERTSARRAREVEEEDKVAEQPPPKPRRVLEDDDDFYGVDPLLQRTIDPQPLTAPDASAAALREAAERQFPLAPGDLVDYEELARAMRTVIERERDEMVKRGGPIEKQNIELKERLAKQYEETALFRGRFQRKCEEYNLLQEQLEVAQKTIRKQRNELAGRRSNAEHVRILELDEILKVVQNAGPDWKVERQGNGHFGVRFRGEYVTDLASSGQGNKVNMASRNKLKKLGLRV